MTLGTPLGGGAREVVLALADDEHVMGQRHTEWIGVAPFLEEDLAFASIGQDELGHAAMLYELLSDDIDDLALGRPPEQYRSCWLVEHPCTDWSDAIVRHWLYDSAEPLRWKLFENSSIPSLVGIAKRAEREEAFHLRHGEAMIDVLWSSQDARDRLTDSLAQLLPLALGMFEPVGGENEAITEGVVSASVATLFDEWTGLVDARFGDQDWVALGSEAATAGQGGRTVRSSAFQPMYDSMREVLMLDPTATW